MRAAAIPLLAGLLVQACVPLRPPAPTVDPRGVPITTAEIIAARTEKKQNLYGFGLALLGGAAGVLAGGKVGYEIGYADDIRQGCEDCGLEGLLLGAAVGVAAGTIIGGNLGMHAGARADNADAVERIIVQRARSAYFYREKNSHIVGAPLPRPGMLVTPSASSDSRSTLSNW